MIWTSLFILATIVLAAATLMLLIRLRRQAATARELEERVRVEDAGKREAMSLLKMQRDLAVELGSKYTLQESLHCILDVLGAIPGVDSGGVYLTRNGGDLELVAHRNLSPEFVAGNTHIEASSPRGKLVHEGKVISLGYSVLLPDALLEGLRSVLVVPVFFHGKVIAVLNIGSRSVPAIQPHMQTAIEAAAEKIGPIVARIRTQESVKEHEHSFRNLAESAFDAIGIVDARGRFVYVNPQLAEMTGYAVHELLEKPFTDLLHPDQRAILQSRFEDRMKGLPVPARYDALYRRKDGSTVSVRFSARRIAWQGQPAVIGYIQDQTERVRAEKALQETKETIDAFFDFLPIAVVVLDEKTRIVRVNVAGLELVAAGEATELLLKQPGEALHCVHSHDSPEGCGFGPNCPVCDLRRALGTVLTVGGSVRRMQARVKLLRDGAPCDVLLRINAEPILINNQKHIVIAIEDLTTPAKAG